VPLAHAQSMIACRANIEGVGLSVNGDVHFRDVKLH
jgi:hypothetical protein